MTIAPKFDPAAWQPEIQMAQYTLDNGLTILVLPDHSLPILSLQIHYQVGSRHELPGITGISHLFEHLMFRGTETLGPEEFSRILQAKGGEINAFTTRDNTSYFENLPSEHLELGLKLEADRLLHLRLDEETFSSELQVVISERKLRSVDSPLGLVQEQLFATAFTQHPYQWPVVGWNQDLHHLSLADCLAYYRNHYHPGSMTVVIAGDAEPERARDLVARYFADIPNPGVSPTPPFTEPPQRGERRAVVKKVSQVEALLAGYHAVGMDHPDLYPLSLLAIILSGGKASRFYQGFVRPGKAAALEVEMAPLPFASQDPDLLVVAAVAAPGTPLAGLESELWRAIEQLRQDGVQPLELARARKLMRAQLVKSLAHNFFRGLMAGLFQVKTHDASKANQVLAAYEAVTEADILRVAQTYLKEDIRTVVTLQPVSSEESAALGPLE
jgi:zinc protease